MEILRLLLRLVSFFPWNFRGVCSSLPMTALSKISRLVNCLRCCVHSHWSCWLPMGHFTAACHFTCRLRKVRWTLFSPLVSHVLPARRPNVVGALRLITGEKSYPPGLPLNVIDNAAMLLSLNDLFPAQCKPPMARSTMFFSGRAS